MTECGRIRPELKAYADGELRGRLRDHVGAHVDACASCRGELAAIQRLGQELRILETAHPRPELRRRILAEVEQIRASSPRRPRWLAWLDANRLAVATAAAAAVAAVVLVPRMGQMPLPATQPPSEGLAVHEAAPPDAGGTKSALAGQPKAALKPRLAEQQGAPGRPAPAAAPAPFERSRAAAPAAPPPAALRAERLPARPPAMDPSSVAVLPGPGAEARRDGPVAVGGAAAQAVPAAPAFARGNPGSPDHSHAAQPPREADSLHDSLAAPRPLQEKLVMTVDRLDVGLGEVRAAAAEAGGYAGEAVRENPAEAPSLASQAFVTVVVPQDRVGEVKARLMRFQLRRGESGALNGAAVEEQLAPPQRAGGGRDDSLARQRSAPAGPMGGPGGGFGGAGGPAGEERARRSDGQAAGKPAESDENSHFRSARPQAKAGQRAEQIRSRQLNQNQPAAQGAGQAQRSQKGLGRPIPPVAQRRAPGAEAQTLPNSAVPLVRLQVEVREAKPASAVQQKAAPAGKAGQNKGD